MQSFEVSLLMTLLCFSLAEVSVDKEVVELIQLKQNVFDRYVPVIPLCNQHGPMYVYMDLFLYMLVHFDEVNEVIRVSGWYNMKWNDCQLTWNASDYNGLDSAEFPYISDLWTPDVTWWEKVPYVKAFESQLGIFTGARAFVDHQGNVTASRQLVFASNCPIDLLYFPFDTQSCSFTFMSWVHASSQLFMHSPSGSGNLSYAIPTASWHLLRMPESPGVIFSSKWGNFSTLHYVLMLQRPSLFYIFYLLLPAVLIGMLTCFVFLLPPQSQEKLGFILSVVVTITIFMLIMVDITPKSSQIPIMSAYFFTVFVLSSISAAFTVLVEMGYEHSRSLHVPACVQWLVLHTLGHLSFFQPTEHGESFQKRKKKETTRRKQLQLQLPPTQAKNSPVLIAWTLLERQNSVVSENNDWQAQMDFQTPYFVAQQPTAADEVSSTKESHEMYSEWWTVAFAIDRLLFLLYCLATVVIVLTFLVVFASS